MQASQAAMAALNGTRREAGAKIFGVHCPEISSATLFSFRYAIRSEAFETQALLRAPLLCQKLSEVNAWKG